MFVPCCVCSGILIWYESWIVLFGNISHFHKVTFRIYIYIKWHIQDSQVQDLWPEMLPSTSVMGTQHSSFLWVKYMFNVPPRTHPSLPHSRPPLQINTKIQPRSKDLCKSATNCTLLIPVERYQPLHLGFLQSTHPPTKKKKKKKKGNDIYKTPRPKTCDLNCCLLLSASQVYDKKGWNKLTVTHSTKTGQVKSDLWVVKHPCYASHGKSTITCNQKHRNLHLIHYYYYYWQIQFFFVFWNLFYT